MELDWKMDTVDQTLMALILVDLHGNIEDSLSNQMRQTKAMAPAYSIKWWQERKMLPTEKNAKSILEKKIVWRYGHGIFNSKVHSLAIYGDSTKSIHLTEDIGPFQLLLTSPPYYGIINYNYDQWLRRWMLGGPELPLYSAGKYQNRLDNQQEYQELLDKVFGEASNLMRDKGRVVVRTDARSFTLEATMNALTKAFPNKSMEIVHRPVLKKTQTQLFGDLSKKPGEVDLILRPKLGRPKQVPRVEVVNLIA